MAAIVYTFVVRDGGDPTAATGLTPTFTQYMDVETLGALTPPAITEVGSGHYKFSVNWDTAPESTAPTDHIAMVIDAGAGLTDLSERYITGRINRTDDFAATLLTDTTTIITDIAITDGKIDVIDAIVDSLFEIETGKWEVTTGNQLKIYESDGLTLVKTFNLFDINGVATNTNPARREPV